MKREPSFQLVSDNLSNETTKCLQQLLREARAGNVIGIAFTAMLKNRTFIVDAAGEAHANPTFTRGMVSALDDKLAAQVKGKVPWGEY